MRNSSVKNRATYVIKPKLSKFIFPKSEQMLPEGWYDMYHKNHNHKVYNLPLSSYWPENKCTVVIR